MPSSWAGRWSTSLLDYSTLIDAAEKKNGADMSPRRPPPRYATRGNSTAIRCGTTRKRGKTGSMQRLMPDCQFNEAERCLQPRFSFAGLLGSALLVAIIVLVAIDRRERLALGEKCRAAPLRASSGRDPERSLFLDLPDAPGSARSMIEQGSDVGTPRFARSRLVGRVSDQQPIVILHPGLPLGPRQDRFRP